MIAKTLFAHRGNDYGLRLLTYWPHISLGISLHLSTRFAHFDFHTPVGVLVIGCIGASE